MRHFLHAIAVALITVVVYGCGTPPPTEANESAGPGNRTLFCDLHPNDANCKAR